MSNAPYTVVSLFHLFFTLYISLYACGFAKCSCPAPRGLKQKQNTGSNKRLRHTKLGCRRIMSPGIGSITSVIVDSMEAGQRVARGGGGWRRVAPETKKAYHIECGDRPVCQRGRFPG